ncbi:FHA domain-containing protein [Purpureocillium lavendulum]|uniref:FHA domain-containing protein n=1 Tax=Purpureocillium lavendulum TaxID=1247861 RepID=A0AB34FQP6_9HYPO|nr:FHA domain-containing protein [Purpureocillium lavendulum]
MATPQYDDEVQIVLASCGPASPFPFKDRRLFLTKENPTVSIGRTSKRDSALQEAQNNAWIDSAVMSRHHAKLEFDVANKRVLITDIGSLHGTFVNGCLLTPHTPKPLAQNDVLKFGIAVERRVQSFPPCTMRVSVKYGTETRPEGKPAVFRVPDDSDYEEDISDDDDPSILNSAAIMLANGFRPVVASEASRGEVIDLTEAHAVDLENDAVFEDGHDDVAPVIPHDKPTHGGDVLGSDQSSPWQSNEGSPPPESHETDVDPSDESHGSESMAEFPDEPILEFDTTSDVGLSHDLHSSGPEESLGSHESHDCGCDATSGEPSVRSPEHLPPASSFKGMSSQELEAELDADAYELMYHPSPDTLRMAYVALPPLGQHLPAPDHVHLPSITRNVGEATVQAGERSFTTQPPEPIKFVTPTQFNRVRLYPKVLHEPVAQPGQTWMSGDIEPCPSPPDPDSLPAFPVASVKVCDETPNSALLASGAKFLTTPPIDDETKPATVSQLDDTSAYLFEQSKKAAETVEASSRRTHVAINDLLEAKGESLKDTAKDQLGRKRKVAELSTSTPEEEQRVTSVPKQPHRTDTDRPVKRIRKAAEVFGYVALGGVAVVSALIATAPNL